MTIEDLINMDGNDEFWTALKACSLPSEQKQEIAKRRFKRLWEKYTPPIKKNGRKGIKR